jgi:hypothetical protein
VQKAVLFAFLLTAVPAAAQEIRMENGRFVVPGAGKGADLKLYVGTGDVPPIMGSLSTGNGALVFSPRFPLSPGVRVRAVLNEPGKPAVESVFEIPRANTPPSNRIVRVYPSTGVLPVNQLKLYIEFSAPMQRGVAWRHIHLLDDRDHAIELPFLEIDQELWDPEAKRLTVLFDPGRIKRGLHSLEEAGPSMHEGRTYTLVVDREWLDASGAPAKYEFRKRFRAGAADRIPPDPKEWIVRAPAANTTGELTIQFSEPMDYALMSRLIRVESDGQIVSGAISTGANETQWRFAPSEPWKAGSYSVVVASTIEDLAGNRIGRTFDVDTFDKFEKVTARVDRKEISLPFLIGGEQR